MGKIFYIMGKSSSGKDTIYKEILNDKWLNLKNIILYTTRPIREGEKDGVEYFFIDDEKIKEFEKENKIIELREYDTVLGIWKYLTVKDSQIDLDNNNYIMIGTLESYMNVKKYFGADKLEPIYIEVENGERLTRALEREKLQKTPKYAEMCRRFLADEEDFSDEKIKEADITIKFENGNLKESLEKIKDYIKFHIYYKFPENIM